MENVLKFSCVKYEGRVRLTESKNEGAVVFADAEEEIQQQCAVDPSRCHYDIPPSKAWQNMEVRQRIYLTLADQNARDVDRLVQYYGATIRKQVGRFF